VESGNAENHLPSLRQKRVWGWQRGAVTSFLAWTWRAGVPSSRGWKEVMTCYSSARSQRIPENEAEKKPFALVYSVKYFTNYVAINENYAIINSNPPKLLAFSILNVGKSFWR
jgi:hypothetical protein